MTFASPCAETAQSIVVALLRLRQTVSYLGERIDEAGELVVELRAAPGDLLDIALLLLLAPEIGDGAQHKEQGTGTDQEKIFLPCLLPQLVIAGERQHKGRLDGHEHDHEIERLQAIERLVVFFRQSFDMSAHGFQVVAQSRGAGRIAVGVRMRIIGDERDLRVDDEVPLAGKVDHHVRLRPPAILRRIAFLGFVLLPRAQAGALENLLEDQFSPVSLRFARSLEGVGKTVRLLANLRGGLEKVVICARKAALSLTCSRCIFCGSPPTWS